MDHPFDELADCAARREFPPGASAMIHRAICSLVCLVAVSVIPVAAQAGSLTYDFVNPITGTNGYDVRGSITLDSAGISAAPISLTSSMIQSWHISVFNSSNVLQLSLDSSSDIVFVTIDPPPSDFEVAPQVTSSSIYIPIVPLPDSGFINSFIQFQKSPPSTDFVRYNATRDEFDSYIRTSESQLDSSIDLWNTADTTQSIFTVAVAETTSAVVPEPSSLVIATMLFGTLSLVGCWRPRRAQPATEVTS